MFYVSLHLIYNFFTIHSIERKDSVFMLNNNNNNKFPTDSLP